MSISLATKRRVAPNAFTLEMASIFPLRATLLFTLLAVKALIVISFAAALSCRATAATRSEAPDLGLLTNYYLDCPARSGPQANYLRRVIKLALQGDHAAMRSLVMHRGTFSTGDNEGYSEVPEALLRTIGDDRYAAFIVSQPRDVQEAALALSPDQIRGFVLKFPKTARLYRERFAH